MPLERGDTSDSDAFVDLDAGGEANHRQSTIRRALRRALSWNASGMVEKVRTYWHDILANPRARRPPLVTISYLVTCIAVFYLVPGHGLAYDPGPDGPWYGALAAMCSHVNEEHLWTNGVMLILLGWFLEFTEGFRHTASVIYGGGLLGAALHGALKPDRRVRGASGAIYGVMWSQLSLLALNWKEMPLRWARLIVCITLLVFDVAVYWFERRANLSYESHLFGAAAGVCVALVLGKNVKLRRRELTFIWAGVGGYAALVTVGYVQMQFAASLLASALLPVLVLRAAVTTRRALVRSKSRRPIRMADSHHRPFASNSTRRRQRLQHGTHRALVTVARTVLVLARTKSGRDVAKDNGRINGAQGQQLGVPKELPRPPPRRAFPGDTARAKEQDEPVQAPAKAKGAKAKGKGKSPGGVRFSDKLDGPIQV